MKTYRYSGHSMSDPAKYRKREEVKDMRQHHDPINMLKHRLIERKLMNEEEAKKIALATDEELDRKEKEYEEAILYATECEAAMKEYEQKCIAFERSGGTDSSQGTEEILNEIDDLHKEMKLRSMVDRP